ncbi:hypothetical protein KY285_023647 [Solanum tuberosum]|nr:hypothetical protein KY289_025745 [Solanum tuberosum]KAH0675846.1 hypothetical protein KY285_023647 [Solanum tuberosum]
MLHQYLPKLVAKYAQKKLQYEYLPELSDHPWWMKTSSGKFSMGSAWEEIRQKGHEKEEYVSIWSIGVPYKICFLLWRLWKYKIPMDEVLKTLKINLVSRCRCCEKAQEETMVHLFINGEFARSIWKYYANAIGLQGPFIQVHQAIKKWWDIRHCAKLTLILQAVPAFICWQLWKRRNTIEHGGI